MEVHYHSMLYCGADKTINRESFCLNNKLSSTLSLLMQPVYFFLYPPVNHVNIELNKLYFTKIMV